MDEYDRLLQYVGAYTDRCKELGIANPGQPWIPGGRLGSLEVWVVVQAEIDLAIANEEAEQNRRLWNGPLATLARSVLAHKDDDPDGYNLLRQYLKEREQLFWQRVTATGHRLCQYCWEAKPDVALVLQDWRGVSGDSDCRGSWEYTHLTRRLWHYCQACQDNQVEPERYTVFKNRRELLYHRFWPAERRPEGVWCQLNGAWQPVPQYTEDIAIAKKPYLSYRMELAWDLPPELKREAWYLDGVHQEYALVIPQGRLTCNTVVKPPVTTP